MKKYSLGDRDIFLKGYRWKVGNGRHIFIVDDPSIPKSENHKTCVIKDDFMEKRVADLISPERAWNANLVKDVFLHDA